MDIRKYRNNEESQKQMGLSIDWSREIATCDKLYYKNQQNFS